MLVETVVVSFIAGALTLLFIQWTLIQKFVLKDEKNDCDMPKPKIRRCELPEEMREFTHEDSYRDKVESWTSINLILQFLFKEWSDTSSVRRFFMKKITSEFETFLQNTTAGKFIENIHIKDLFLGTKCPVFKDVKVTDIALHPVHGHLKEVNIELNVNYSGGCELYVEAETVLGKSAGLAVKVTKLEGCARLQLTQDPYSHWSFSFLEPPITQFEVKSQLLPQITSLIIAQIRRILKKRHTLPNYKIRYKPFCLMPEMRYPASAKANEVDVVGTNLSNGYLCVNVIECSRLFETPSNSMIYATLAIDSCAWVEIASSQSSSWVTQDIEISKGSNQAVGIVLKQQFILDRYDYFVAVETIVPNSPASHADIKKNDLLVAIGGLKVTTVTHAVKLFKQAGDKFVIRTERKSNLKCSQSQEFLNKDFKVNEEMLSLKDDEGSQGEDDEDFISYTVRDTMDTPKKSTSSGLHKQLMHRKHDEAMSSPKMKRKKTDDNDGVSIKSGSSARFNSENNLNVASADTESIGSAGAESDKSSEIGFLGSDIDLKKTTPLKSSTDPIWEEKFEFLVTTRHKYLNLGIWCKPRERKQERILHRTERDNLIGYTSICLSDIALECATTFAGAFQQTYSLMPPEPKAVVSRDHKLSTQAGFNHKLCYGDITLLFVHRPDSNDLDSVQSDDDNNVSFDNKIEQDEFSTNVEPKQSHDFIEAHFHASTICDYCHKKIWLKTAFQCRNCAMICHKKCVDKCQTHTICLKSTVDGIAKSDIAADTVSCPNIITTVIDNDDLSFDTILVGTPSPSTQSINVFESHLNSDPMAKRKRSISAIISNLTSQSKHTSLSEENVANVNNLAPPSVSSLCSGSKSLPGSPHHSPHSSRKCSLQENPFTMMHKDDDIHAAIERLLQHHPQDEMLVSSAKSSGKQLYANLPLNQRKIKLNFMIAKLQNEITDEDKRRFELSTEEKTITDLAAKTKLTFLKNKSDEKAQALAVLMLHYFAGLQHCNEIENSAAEEQGSDTVDAPEDS